jgi:hypothetical protein
VQARLELYSEYVSGLYRMTHEMRCSGISITAKSVRQFWAHKKCDHPGC